MHFFFCAIHAIFSTSFWVGPLWFSALQFQSLQTAYIYSPCNLSPTGAAVYLLAELWSELVEPVCLPVAATSMENGPPPEETGSPSAAETGESGWGGSSEADGTSFEEESRDSLLPLSGTSFEALLTSACPATVDGLLVTGKEGLAGTLTFGVARGCWVSLVCDGASDVVLSLEEDTFRGRFRLGGGIGASMEVRF